MTQAELDAKWFKEAAKQLRKMNGNGHAWADLKQLLQA